MDTSSEAKIKLLGRLSNRIDIHVGTEQGHPLSPELFKIYINDLSDSLNNINLIEVPTLNGKKVSHLLCADDLVLLALNKESLQSLINVLQEYCVEWGLKVNMKKTAIMVFNKAGRILKCSKGVMYGEQEIPSVSSYCYFGIIFTLAGSFKKAAFELHHKANRGYHTMH